MERKIELIDKLVSYPIETEWIEFKENNYDPEMIGQDICALANSATLHNKRFAYMVWGVNDETHDIVGTNKNLKLLKKGNEELENWLRRLLSRQANFHYHYIEYKEDVYIGLMIIDCAVNEPIKFRKREYIRVGSYTKSLNDYSRIQVDLWDKLRSIHFEELDSIKDVTTEDIRKLLDYHKYFDFLDIPEPGNEKDIIYYLERDEIVRIQDNGLYSITNLGAILFAKDLRQFHHLEFKGVRIIQYKGTDRRHIIQQIDPKKGYAISFDSIIRVINVILPSEEVIDVAIRKEIRDYPINTIREAVANLLIHQDFTCNGSPLIEIFSNRIEFTNPGNLLVDSMHILDTPPISRNTKLSSLMRRMGMCEEAGAGWDNMVRECEKYHLPAPMIDIYDTHTKIIIKESMKLENYMFNEALWTCYLHSCIHYMNRDSATVKTLSERFQVDKDDQHLHKLIQYALEKQYIKEYPSFQYPQYIPYWA